MNEIAYKLLHEADEDCKRIIAQRRWQHLLVEAVDELEKAFVAIPHHYSMNTTWDSDVDFHLWVDVHVGGHGPDESVESYVARTVHMLNDFDFNWWLPRIGENSDLGFTLSFS